MHFEFLQKSRDVTCSPDLLKSLGADRFLYLRGVEITDYLSASVAVLEKRSRILRDTAEIPGLNALVDEWITSLTYLSELVRKKNGQADGERNLYSVKQLSLYFEIIDRACAAYEEIRPALTSDDYIALFDALHSLADDEYRRFKRGTAQLLDDIAKIKSISIGFNFDASLSPNEAGILSVNNRYIESGTLIDRLLRGDSRDSLCSVAPLVVTKRQITPDEFDVLEHALYTGVDKLFKKQLRQWEPEITAFLADKLGFLLEILPDLRFISGLTELGLRMRECGLPLCRPVFTDPAEKHFKGKGLYNPVLAMKFSENGRPMTDLVRNDLSFDDDGRLFLLTGPNNGGKSVFLSAVCLIQFMAQLGMMVPADAAEISPVTHIHVHFPKFRSLNEKGRLAEECEDIAAIFSGLDGAALVVMDEAFSSTDVRDAVTLSDTVLRALAHTGVRGIFATHFHELSSYADEINADNAGDRNASRIDFLVAGVAENETRTYRIVRRPPDGRSFAQTIAKKYGIVYEELIHSTKERTKINDD
ncbi:MAG: hypothetical protein IJ449_07235 [Clostridia bacterium]|nr:hypothetical protein [Clostridia bacterium]